MRRGDIYLVSLDPTLGHEQKGTRPVLVISSDEFNRKVGTPFIVPITSGGNFARMAGFSVALTGSATKTTGVVRCDQVRTLDLRARGARRLEMLPAPVVEEVLAKVRTFFD